MTKPERTLLHKLTRMAWDAYKKGGVRKRPMKFSAFKLGFFRQHSASHLLAERTP